MGPNDRDSHGVGVRPEDGESVPEELRRQEHWLVAKFGEDRKPPLLPRSPTAVDEALAFDEAMQIADEPTLETDLARQLKDDEQTLVGFMITSDDPYVFVDWDDVRDPAVGNDSVPAVVLALVEALGGYLEVSPSGTGLKTISRSDGALQDVLDEHGTRGSLNLPPVGDLEEPPHLEIYSDRHYTTVTGNVFVNPRSGRQYDTLSDGGSALLRIAEEQLSPSPPASSNSSGNTDGGTNGLTEIGRRSARQWRNDQREYPTHSRSSESMEGEWIETDRPTVKQIRATGCACDDDFRRLWRGNHRNYKSVSEADLALVSKLWYYAGDRDVVDKAFRESGLYEIRQKDSTESPWSGTAPKWDYDPYRENTLDSGKDNDRHDGQYFDPTL